MPGCPRRRAEAAVAGSVLLVAAAVLAVGLGVPWLRPVLLVGAAWASVAAVVVGVVVHRPARRRAWAAIALMLTCWAVAQTWAALRPGGAGPAPVEAMVAGQLVGAVLVARLFTGRRRRGRRLPRWEPGPMVEHVLLVAVVALATAQLVAHLGASGPRVLGLATAALDVVLLALVLRFVLSRTELAVSSRLLALGAVIGLGYHLAGALAAAPPGPGSPLQAVGAACFVIIGGAALVPSMPRGLDGGAHLGRRTASVQLLGLVPLVGVAPALWFVDRVSATSGGLPAGAFVTAGAVLAALGMLRGVEALRSSERAADHDPLTGLRNRRGLDGAFRRLVHEPDGLLLCLVDLDDFKAVNDTYGHEVGDELLRSVAAALVRVAGPDAVVARQGGDEFVVLLPGTPVPREPGSSAAASAGGRRVHDETPARLVAALARPQVVAGHELRGSASLGVVHVVAPSSLPQALTRADIALYETKADGGAGATTYRPRMRTQVQRRQRLAEDLRLALEGAPAGRVGALVVHHQPLVLLETGEVVGFEALVRWHHPQLGLLPPADFLTVAHETGRDVEVDAHVLDLALAQVGGWLRAGLDAVPVSVNVTPAILVEGGLAARVERALRRHGVPARLLRLEITEHEQVPASPQVVRELQELQRSGVRISLDDFGAGYTSLGYLQRFPVSLLKLDRSLVTSLEDDPGLLTGIAAMARALRLDVLAEGVETPAQRALLVDLGIRYGQGHLFSPALAAEHMEALLHPVVPAQAPPPGAERRRAPLPAS